MSDAVTWAAADVAIPREAKAIKACQCLYSASAVVE